MDAVCRHEASGSDAKGFITHSMISSINFLFGPFSPAPQGPWGWCRVALVDPGRALSHTPELR